MGTVRLKWILQEEKGLAGYRHEALRWVLLSFVTRKFAKPLSRTDEPRSKAFCICWLAWSHDLHVSAPSTKQWSDLLDARSTMHRNNMATLSLLLLLIQLMHEHELLS